MTAIIHDLAALPSGTRVFVDTNIFDLHFRGKSATCTALMSRIATGDVEAYVNTQILSDLLHKMMMAEAEKKGYITKRNASKLKYKLSIDRTINSQLIDYQTNFENLLAIGIKVLRISRKTLVETKLERSNYGLMTGDSLHLGTMNRHTIRLDNIVTQDGDFEHIPGLIVWKPNDVITT